MNNSVAWLLQLMLSYSESFLYYHSICFISKEFMIFLFIIKHNKNVSLFLLKKLLNTINTLSYIASPSDDVLYIYYCVPACLHRLLQSCSNVNIVLQHRYNVPIDNTYCAISDSDPIDYGKCVFTNE